MKKSKIQISKNSKIQKSEISKIRKFENSKIQQISKSESQNGGGMGIESANGILEDICGEIGYTATTALVSWFGGNTLYIPQSTADQERHIVRNIIGESAFNRLVGSYGSEILSIPMDDDRIARMRRMRRIAGLLTNGVSIKDIARLEAMSHRHVHNIRMQLETAGILSYILHAGDVMRIMNGQMPLNLEGGTGEEGVSDK